MLPALIILILLVICLYFFLILPRLSKKEEMKAFNHTMFAHRGYHCADKLIPENSMPAFKAAVAHGYGIELDIHLTKDQQLAVFHDDTLERMCNVPGSPESYTYKELLQLHLLNTSEHIPLLSDVLSYVNGRVPLLIELKIPGHSLAICKAAYQLLKDYNGPYLIQSFHTMGLHWFRIHAPHVLRGQLSSNLIRKPSKEPWILRFSITYLLCNFLGRPDFISYKLKELPVLSVTICQRLLELPVAVWTLRSEAALLKGKTEYNMQIFERNGEFY